MFLKIVGFLIMLPTILYAILTSSIAAYAWFVLGGCIYYLGHRKSERAIAARDRMPCPQCGEPVLKVAKLCPHCRSTLTPSS